MATPTLVQKSKISSSYPTSTMTALFPTTVTTGNCVVIAIEGAKLMDPYSDPAAGIPTAGVVDLTLNTPDPVVKDNNGLVYTPIERQLNYDGDLGYWISLYLYVKEGAASGVKSISVSNTVPVIPATITNITVASNVLTVTIGAGHSFCANQQVKLTGITLVGATDINNTVVVVASTTATTFTATLTHANVSGASAGTATSITNGGRPIFDHGLNMQVYEFSGIVASSAVVSHASKVTNSKTPSHALVPSQTSDMSFALALFRRSSAFTVPAAHTLLDSGFIEGTGTDFWSLSFTTNTLGLATITNIALTSNVLTITAANTLTQGQQVVISGLTAGDTTAGDINPGTITNIKIASNVLTVNVSNSYTVGSQVLLNGITLAGATDLNGSIVTVTSASGSSFQAAVAHANVGSGGSAGTTNLVLTVASAVAGSFTVNLTHSNIATIASAGTVTPLVTHTFNNPNGCTGGLAGAVVKHS